MGCGKRLEGAPLPLPPLIATLLFLRIPQPSYVHAMHAYTFFRLRQINIYLNGNVFLLFHAARLFSFTLRWNNMQRLDQTLKRCV